MNVIGIVYEHDPTVCLMEDGKVTFCQSEERITRHKGCYGFPVETLRHVYRHVAPPESIDLAAVYEKSIIGMLVLQQHRDNAPPPSWDSTPSPLRALKKHVLMTEWGMRLSAWKSARTERHPRLRRDAEAYFASLFQLEPGRIRYVDHHSSHAHSVLPNIADWGRALVLTLDGSGDGACATVNLLERGKIERISSCGDRHSLGFYYSDTTVILGLKAFEDEFKLMGLAPYAKPEEFKPLLERLRRLLRIDERGEWKSALPAVARFESLERAYRRERFDHIAGAIQALTEELVVAWVRYWIAKTDCRNVAVAGGVFMNVKASQRLAQLPEVDRLFVMPSAGDESCAIGAAVWGTRECAPDTPLQPLGDLYLGVAYSEAEVERTLVDTQAASRYTITKPPDIDREVARLLAQNAIVARCSGRMEFGARALGNRSILANPGDPSNVQRINAAIKGRDFWMPFAPSILEEDMDRYVHGHERIFAPYMCVAFDSTPAARRELPAVIHPADGTLRPQAIRQAWNPGFHAIVSAFKAMTGIGAVLNTSFNLHGEPIVCSPADAIRTADRSGLEFLVLGKSLLAKRDGAA
jgi:carbamoyltransferase